MSEVLKVLLIEDDEDDCLLTRSLLADGYGDRFRLDWSDSPAEGLERLLSGSYDVALVDHHLGGTTGIELLQQACAGGLSTPVIMLTGQSDRATDINAMNAGAADFLVKGRVTGDLLERAIRYARERHRLLERISALSLTDELTGLHNRRAFMTMADQRLQLLERSGALVMVVFADVDDLKWTNDTRGHEAGDALIIAAAEALRSTFRRTDLLARLGGDEFVALCEVSDEKAEELLLEKLQQQIAERNVQDPTVPLSMSAGATSFRSGPGIRLQDLLAEADLRMLDRKNQRRSSRSRGLPPGTAGAPAPPAHPAPLELLSAAG